MDFTKNIFFRSIKRSKRKFGVTKQIGKIVKKYSHGKCLDAGCGTGEYFNLFNSKEIIGLDLTQEYLDKINTGKFLEKKISLIKADIRKIPFNDNYFDFILCSEVFEYIPEEDTNNTLNELERVSSKNGVIVISVPNGKFVLGFIRNFLYNNLYGNPNKNYTNMGRVFSTRELNTLGFEVHGCYGYVSRRDIGLSFAFDLLDFLAWYFPNLGGTLIGIKKIKK